MVVADEEEYRRLPATIEMYRAGQALARGDAEDVLTLADDLRRDAAGFGTRRYEDFAYLLGVRAALSLGRTVDLSVIEPTLRRLPGFAGLEAWWLTAEIAAATHSTPLWAIAESHAQQLAENAGDLADAFRRFALAHFSALGR